MSFILQATEAAQRASAQRTQPASAPQKGLRRWLIAGLLLGLLAALVLQAPAGWLARWLATASGGHVLVVDSRGTAWNGSGELILTGGPGSRDASRLPGRVHWRLGFSGLSPELRLRLDCCSNGELPLRLQPGWSRLTIALPARAEPLLRLPAAWLGGLGTPWNTLQLGGQLRLSANEFQLEWQGGRWLTRGQLSLEFSNLSSRLSTLAPLGSYRLNLHSQAEGPSRLQLMTLDGALQLQGEGTVGGAAKSRFTGEARAAPGREAALNNLLNIIGRRQGERSVITIG